ncbi:hypothetical protein PIB30_031448 [Stylosanthes scabra]|uniref:C2H2-type domain-containing protein n=1 Tax=Stylosanthes scabra TaxID=79078 RepID=A0ABU6SBQ8_9FABA|nr:hypothetical protein [Stylosanthes scabra]
MEMEMDKNNSSSASASVTTLSPSTPVTEPSPSPPPPQPVAVPSSPIVDEPNNLSDDEEGKSPVVNQTPEEVLADLTTNDGTTTIGGNPPPPPPIPGLKRRRKAPQIKDPPTGAPICPVCNKTFHCWKAAFGHMRTHPDREYRGFFRPPNFSSSLPAPATGQAAGGGEGGATAPVRNRIDLNHVPMVEGVEKIQIVAWFDLNRRPADDRDDYNNMP